MLLSCSFERCLSSARSNTLPSWWKEQSQEIVEIEKVVRKEDGLGLHEARGSQYMCLMHSWCLPSTDVFHTLDSTRHSLADGGPLFPRECKPDFHIKDMCMLGEGGV